MIFLNIGVLVFVAGGVWWLTGIDKTAGGESKRKHYVSRSIRCAAVTLLVAAFLFLVEQPGLGIGGIPLLLIIPVSIALILRSSVSEAFTHGFLRLVDPELHDERPFDPGRGRRYMDTISHLIQNGRRDEAIKLCEELKLSGEVELTTLETTLEFLGVKQTRIPITKPLAIAARLRSQGKITEAEQMLKSMLVKNPADTDAAMMLMRLFAQDLRQPDQAREVLRALEKQPHVSASHLEFARRSIDEWSRTKPAEPQVATPPESVDELLAQKRFGSALEKLTEEIKMQPQVFGLQLKLAELHAVHFNNFRQAEKIIRQLETTPDFSPQQIESAWVQLKAWRAAAGNSRGLT